MLILTHIAAAIGGLLIGVAITCVCVAAGMADK